MRALNSIADRMLKVFVPHVQAAAGCTGYYTAACGPCYETTKGFSQSQKTCYYYSNCTLHCTPCSLVSCSNGYCCV